MAWRTYGNKGYPTYNNVPAQEGGYAHGSKQPTNWYVVETTTIERIRTPATRYINFGDQEFNHGTNTLINPKHAPQELINPQNAPKELINPKHAPKELISPKHAPKDHREGNKLDYGSDNENSSPPRDHGRESLMDKFRNKLQIKTSQPTKTSDLLIPNKHQPTSPVHNHPSEEAHPIKSQNLFGLNKHQPTNPEHKYRPEEAHMIRNKSFSDPNKYKSSSPERSYPSEESHFIRPKNLSGPNKYQPSSPVHNYPSEEPYLTRSRNLSGPNKYQPTSTVYNYPSDEDQLIRTRNWSGLDNPHPSIPSSRIGQFGHISGPKNHWQSAGPPMTHHPLTNVTNDINEALGFLEESINYSPHSGQLRTREFDYFPPHPQPIEPEWQYARPTFAGPTNFRTNIIDSQEAIRKYQGTRVP